MQKNPNMYLTLCTKINSKWITNLNIKLKSIKFLEESIGENLCDLGLDKDFLGTKQKHNPSKKSVNEISTKVISVLSENSLKDTVKRMKRQVTS